LNPVAVMMMTARSLDRDEQATHVGELEAGEIPLWIESKVERAGEQ
jgi:hypothetical protein